MLNTSNDMENDNSAELTARYINSTNRHIFLTGKAGTGKTTFLRDIVNKTHKKTVVAAPTGIAAINAGGVTLHSFFQLPFGTFLPSDELPLNQYTPIELSTPKSLLKSLKLNQSKRQLIQSIELLIIDEVSMLRADILDAIDLTLRSIRKTRDIPFGGVQLLLIGDLLQLPPVVKNEEWPWLAHFYPSMYFFNALALKERAPLYIELEKVYRQADPTFINLLNKLRKNEINQTDIELLNKYYNPEIEKKPLTEAIFITTHNKMANDINSRELEKLKGKSNTFKAVVGKEFQPNSFPIELELRLKKGARVMFIKNDYSGNGRYFNGKIGTVTDFDEQGPIVSFDDGSDPFIVERYTWENKRYTLNENTNEIETTIKGTFSHYPLKLAWAVTVHKSQGLTFDKAIIDVSRAFAPGQIYVALSRLTSLNGLILNSKIPEDLPQTEATLKDFSKNKQTNEALNKQLKTEAWKYIIGFTEEAFSFKGLITTFKYHAESYNKTTPQSKKHHYKKWANDFPIKLYPLNTTGEKFIDTVKRIASQNDEKQTAYLHERTQAAKKYFENELKKIHTKLKHHIEEIKKIKGTKGYLKELYSLENSLWTQIEKLHKATVLTQAYVKNATPKNDAFKYPRPIEISSRKKKPTSKDDKEGTNQDKKKDKTPTHLISFELFKDGQQIEDIAQTRGFQPSTIESHLGRCVEEKLLDILDVIPEETYELIKKAAHTIKSYRLNKIKAVISDDYSYGQIRLTLSGMKIKNEMDDKIAQATREEIEAEKAAKEDQ